MSIVVFIELERGRERLRKALPSQTSIRWATDFETCMSLVCEPSCSGVILGVYFGKGSVFEFVSAIRNNFPAMPVVCCCSYLAKSPKWDTPIETACRVLGANGYIPYEKFYSGNLLSELGAYLPEIAQVNPAAPPKDGVKKYD